MTTGQQAKAYADHFIAVHLDAAAGGRTYSEVSGQYLAECSDPAAATSANCEHLASQKQTLFQGETLRGLLQRALWLAERCADIEAVQILRARLTNLQAAALLVIVGEVKAGKSSFINALLREDVCEVAPGPCTVRIQELVYAAERKIENLGDSWQLADNAREIGR